MQSCVSDRARCPLPCGEVVANCCTGSVPARGRTVHERQCGINELHLHAVQGLRSRGDVQQVQDDWLVWPQHGAAGHLDGQAVANLACVSSHTPSVLAAPLTLLHDGAWSVPGKCAFTLTHWESSRNRQCQPAAHVPTSHITSGADLQRQ